MLKLAIAAMGIGLALAAPQQSNAMPVEAASEASGTNSASPAPGTLGVVGLSLIGIAALRGRKKA